MQNNENSSSSRILLGLKTFLGHATNIFHSEEKDKIVEEANRLIDMPKLDELLIPQFYLDSDSEEKKNNGSCANSPDSQK